MAKNIKTLRKHSRKAKTKRRNTSLISKIEKKNFT